MRALEFITGHVIFNPDYTYKFQLKTTQAIMKNQDQNQKELLEAMNQLKKKIENPLNQDHVAELQMELEATKNQMEAQEKEVEATKKEVEATRKQLEEEKDLRRQSKLKRIAQMDENISEEPGNTLHVFLSKCDLSKIFNYLSKTFTVPKIK